MTSLTLSDVAVSYHNHPVIKRLNWQVQDGKIHSIIGPNGCGKSTLLKAVSGQLKPAGGSVLIGDKPVGDYPRRLLARMLSMLQQSQDKPPDMTVRSLVGYGRFPHKPLWAGHRQEDEDIIERALQQTGMIPLADRMLTDLSGGERQRAWIALALAQKPRILLLDEPTTYLDVNHQWEILQLISEINREYGVTIIMVLHDIQHAAAFSDEILIMDKGSVYACGKPEETITEQALAEVFGVQARIERDAENGRLTCLITGLMESRFRNA